MDVETSVDNMAPLHMKKVQMGSERQCGLGSLLPMSCRGRAEAFARRLHTRLRRLGAEPGSSAHEATWLTSGPNQQHPDSDVYFDFDVELESPSSPVDEVPENSEISNSLPTNHHSDPESGCVFSSPADNESSPSNNSDSDANYFELENDPDQPSAKLANFLAKYQKDEANISKNFSKLKLSTPASDILEHLLQNKSISPERQSPIRTQPLARENGFADYGSLEKRDSSSNMYAPIRFDDCKKKDSSPMNGHLSPREYPIDRDEGRYLSNEVDEIEIEIVDEDAEESEHTDCTVREATSKQEDDAETSEKIVDDETDEQLPDAEESKPEIEVSNAYSSEDNDCEIEEDRPQRVRRCSSLRTGKTPPGTPGRKKIVRFADVLGLDLADVKTFMDDIPNIPKSAFEDLRDADLSTSPAQGSFTSQEIPRATEKRLVPLFQQPGDQPNFLDILNARSVCLENAVVQEGATLAIYGTVRVRNLDFHKSVQVRYTLDGWQTFSDLQATYVPNSCDGFSDRFQFLLYAHTLVAGQKLGFAVRFMCKGCQFWDNNMGTNYSFQCISATSSSTSNFYHPTELSTRDTWQASFY